GRVVRHAVIKVGPIRLRWRESFSEWQINRRLMQTRHFENGPIGLFKAGAEIEPEGSGSRLAFVSEIECVGVLGLIAKYSGLIEREGDKRLAAIEQLIRESDVSDHVPGESTHDRIGNAARRRLDDAVAALMHDPAAHGLAPRLVDLLNHAPVTALR